MESVYKKGFVKNLSKNNLNDSEKFLVSLVCCNFGLMA